MRWAELSEVLGSIQADAELAKDLSATADVSAHAVARSRRRRELLLGLVAVVVLGAALELTLLVQDRPPSGWTNIEERKLSISAEYATAWHHQRSTTSWDCLSAEGSCSRMVGTASAIRILAPDRDTSAWNMSALPSDAVVMEISQTLRFLMTCRETERFPLSLDNAERTRGAYGSPPRLFLSGCIEGKPGFGIHVWIWPDASSEDRKFAREVVSSIHPPSSGG